MARLKWLVFLVAAAVAAQVGGSRAAPDYSAETVYNAASFEQKFASGMLVAIAGKNLAWAEKWRQESDLRGATLPTTLQDTWVTVTVAGLPAAIEYASPDLVLFLLPPGLKAVPVSVRLAVAGIAGPKITLKLGETAPALYRLEANQAMVKHGDTGEFVTVGSPARPGEELILFANGLGATSPAQRVLTMPTGPAELKARDALRIYLNGNEIPAQQIGYAGIMPGYPAFFEIRLRLPDSLPDDPEIRVCAGNECSPSGTILKTTGPAVEPNPPQPETGDEQSNQ